MIPISLTEQEQKQLRLQARRSVGRVSERIHYVLLFSRGHTAAQIAALYDLDERTVLSWIERFRQQGTAGLDDRPRSGRPRLATVVAQTEAKHALEAAPTDTGADQTVWTRRLLQRHLAERTGCDLSLPTVTRLMRRLGFVWRRPKLVLKQGDPHRDEREAAIAQALAAHPDAPHLYADECDLHQLPVVRGQWQPKGSQTAIATPGRNQKQPIFGFLEATSGQWHYWLTLRKRSLDFLSCLHELNKTYAPGPLLLFLDNATIHTSRTTRHWLANHPRFQVCYLPAYSGHQTNPVEKIWWALKNQCAANCLYPSREAIQDAIAGFFAWLTPADTKRLTARRPPQAAV
jgi:transposase